MSMNHLFIYLSLYLMLKNKRRLKSLKEHEKNKKEFCMQDQEDVKKAVDQCKNKCICEE